MGTFRSTKAGIKLHTVYDPDAEVPVFFGMTEARVNDRKALLSLPAMSAMTYVIDWAYNDYGGYYALDQQNATFFGSMKANDLYEVLEERAVEGDGIRSDQWIRLSAEKARKDCPIT